MISEELKIETITSFTKYINKSNAKKIVDSLILFSADYSNSNNIPFLEEEIFNTKKSDLIALFEKSNILSDMIKCKTIDPSNICNLTPEELDPEKYENIIKKKELLELKKNNNSTTDAYTCKKCKNKKCNVTERQTRAGDEPATVFITCVECGYTFTI